MKPMVDLVCTGCGKLFQRVKYEVDSQHKKGRTVSFCTQSCSTSHFNKVTPRGGQHLPKYSDNRRDDFTPFRWFILRARQRVKKKGPTDITAEYLKTLWDSQGGICPLTGWDLELPHSTVGWVSGLKITCASLDRIDNNKGYTVGNVRFVAVIANLARSQFSDEDVFAFCKSVMESRKTRAPSVG